MRDQAVREGDQPYGAVEVRDLAGVRRVFTESTLEQGMVPRLGC